MPRRSVATEALTRSSYRAIGPELGEELLVAQRPFPGACADSGQVFLVFAQRLAQQLARQLLHLGPFFGCRLRRRDVADAAA